MPKAVIEKPFGAANVAFAEESVEVGGPFAAFEEPSAPFEESPVPFEEPFVRFEERIVD